MTAHCLDCEPRSANVLSSDWPVFPIAVDLGSVTSSAEPIVWVIGLVRDPSVSYTIGGQAKSLRPYYTTQYSTVESAVCAIVSQYVGHFMTHESSVEVLHLGLQQRTQPSADPRRQRARASKQNLA